MPEIEELFRQLIGERCYTMVLYGEAPCDPVMEYLSAASGSRLITAPNDDLGGIGAIGRGKHPIIRISFSRCFDRDVKPTDMHYHVERYFIGRSTEYDTHIYFADMQVMRTLKEALFEQLHRIDRHSQQSMIDNATSMAFKANRGDRACVMYFGDEPLPGKRGSA